MRRDNAMYMPHSLYFEIWFGRCKSFCSVATAQTGLETDAAQHVLMRAEQHTKQKLQVLEFYLKDIQM